MNAENRTIASLGTIIISIDFQNILNYLRMSVFSHKEVFLST